MDFKTAYRYLRKGCKIKLPHWGGYWVWENDTVMMYCKNGDILDIRETKDVNFTISNINCDDWEIIV